MRRKLLKILLAVCVVAVGTVWLLNTSRLAGKMSDGGPKILAHRGVHQQYSREGLDNETCTASRMLAGQHGFIENTIPSMEAAFGAGADVVELDVHLTLDGKFAVFHDWTLDCRTNGTGVTEQAGMPMLKTLDIGFGYTADNGVTYPLRGTGTGAMPTLDEVFEAFPNRQFLVNFKSRRVEEGEALAQMVELHPSWRGNLFGVYGGDKPTREAMKLIDGLRGYDKRSLIGCLARYEAYGWTGVVPGVCRDTIIVVPFNYAWALWGWPDRFLRRMADVNTTVILSGPHSGKWSTTGIDHNEQLAIIPEHFNGFV